MQQVSARGPAGQPVYLSAYVSPSDVTSLCAVVHHAMGVRCWRVSMASIAGLMEEREVHWAEYPVHAASSYDA